MTTGPVFEYSPALVTKIHLLFSLWTLVLLSFRVCLPHRQPLGWNSKNDALDYHLTVDFCDVLPHRWWMSYQMREMTDVIWINTFPPQNSPVVSKSSIRVWFTVKGDSRSDSFSFSSVFLIKWHKGSPAVSWQERGKGGNAECQISLTGIDLIKISVSWTQMV